MYMMQKRCKNAVSRIDMRGGQAMKYRNFIFDFGNVIGRFNGSDLLAHFCSSDEDCALLGSVIFRKWNELDKGSIDYASYAEESVSLLPQRLADTARDFFRIWPQHVALIDETLAFIDELTAQGIRVYLLSNAPTYFADYALEHIAVLKKFSGVVFSAPLKTAKPDPAMYRYLFETYSLDPAECFFIDDLRENIEAGRALGMDGIIFDGNIDAVRTATGLDPERPGLRPLRSENLPDYR